MSKKRKSTNKAVLLTDRTLNDLIFVEKYSVEMWEKRVANRYMDDLESALQRLSANSDLLHQEPNLLDLLYFYRVNKHLLVCDIQSDAIYVLTVVHASMDVSERLIELEPTLKTEIDMLHQRLKKTKKGSR